MMQDDAPTEAFELVCPTTRIVAVLPAHNEEYSVGAAINSLRRQTIPPDRIVVIDDRSQDDTVGEAIRAGAEVISLTVNDERKSGALNAVLPRILGTLAAQDYVLVMDADSSLNEKWIEDACHVLTADQRVGAVCGAFLGESGAGLLGQIQRNEFFRYARLLQRRWQALVLSGTGSLFRSEVLRTIAQERGTTLPGVLGDIYRASSPTEDNEITIATKTIGWRCMCLPSCETLTEVMPSWKMLWKQRLRWQRGALRDLRSYGMTATTWWYWLRQLGVYIGYVLALGCYAMMAGAEIDKPGASLFWTGGIIALTFIERTWTARRSGPAGILLAALLVPEVIYSLWQALVFFMALVHELGATTEVEWAHLQEEVTCTSSYSAEELIGS